MAANPIESRQGMNLLSAMFANRILHQPTHHVGIQPLLQGFTKRVQGDRAVVGFSEMVGSVFGSFEDIGIDGARA